MLSENLKTLTSSNYPTIQLFLLKLRTHFLLNSFYRRVCGILFRLELFVKIKKDLDSTHSFFTLLLITQDLNKIKKIPHIILQTLPSTNVCKVSTRNIKIYGSWSSSKFSNFQTKSLVSWK